MPDNFSYDVFVSYSSLDKDWVRGELLKRIEQEGLKAFIDFRDFKRGAPSIKECERGVLECRKTLIVLTPNYLKSGWAEFENIMVQTLDPANESLRLIPLLKVECKKPLRVGALTHIDFTDGADRELAWRQLLTALGAPPAPEPPKQPERDDWFLAHPYPMPPNFTGRTAECAMLTRWLDGDSAHALLVVRALGGFGKSALAWHWLTHDVNPNAWSRVVWWSFYEGDASFDNFLIQTLDYLGKGKLDPKNTSGKNGVNALLQVLRQPGTMLVLDGFERALRAFGGLDAPYQGDEGFESQRAGATSDGSDRDCISPLAEDFLRNLVSLPNVRSKVLLTTRLRPRVLEARGGGLLQGCREEELRQMQPADATEFFKAQGIRGTHTEIEAACDRYGYHPLSLRLLAGLIVGDFQQPGDIATAKRLDVSGDLVQRRHHVLETAYESLMPNPQSLLSRIACFRSPVSYNALEALAQTENNEASGSPRGLDTDLRDLITRGLLHHDTKEGRFDLHPIVRRYAYDRMAVPDRAAAHTRLRDYFAAIPDPDKVTRLEDLAPVIELYHHTVRAGQFDEAHILFSDRIHDPAFYQLGAYSLIIDLLQALFPNGGTLPRLKDKFAQGDALTMLANSYSFDGQPSRAIGIFEQVIVIFEKRGDQSIDNLAISVGNLAYMGQIPIGAFRAAEGNLRRRIMLCQRTKNERVESVGRLELGRLLAYRGAYEKAHRELNLAEAVFDEYGAARTNFVSPVRAHRALCELLRLRSGSDFAIRDSQSPLIPARRALELADERARNRFPVERDYVRAHWILGAAFRVASQFTEAEHHLHEALERCRRINAVDAEAEILVDLARLRAATGAPDEARRLAEEALIITERSGYVLQGADAHLELAKLALARGDKEIANEHAQKAKDLATCDGPPDYTYKAAYDEAGALLEQLN